MSWVFLILAGLFEMLGVGAINLVNRKKSVQSVGLLVVCFGASFLLLTLAMQEIDMSTAYAIWTGIGTAGAAILGMILYKEPRDWKRLVFMVMILGAAVGLKGVS
ncbi:DMT family transporter [Gorillibacterium sp. sgz500922]|uniref:DMT family transporter n=1 Tax=Gorillibacterium sp. sgz500922 TaxID=3446694 RepID=UPI003F6797BB